MSKRIVLVLASFALCGVLAAQGRRPAFAPGQIVVEERAGADPAAVEAALAAVRGRQIRHNMQIHHRVLQVQDNQVDRIIAHLLDTGLFSIAERDGRAYIDNTPNDPSFLAQWHLATINAATAWNTTVGSATPIAVIDSGVDLTHPDLAARVGPGWNFLTGTSNTQDDQGHGTATAGTLAAITNNGVGVSGVTWANPIMPLVVVDSTGYADYSNIANAITYAADHGARIINISIGGTATSSTMQSAVNYAWNKGSVVFAAAGNSSSNAPMYPAGCTNVVAVAATDYNNALASFSNYGSWVDLDAPGTNILTLMSGGVYGYWSGTSFAAPIAAGVGALVLAAKPSLSASALVTLLEQNTDNIGSSSTFGYGLVDAAKAVAAAGSSPTVVPSVSISAPSSNATVSGTVNVTGLAADSLGISSVSLLCDGHMVSSVAGGNFSIPFSSSSTTAGTHTLTVTAVDNGGNSGSSSVSINIPAPPPPPPPPTTPTLDTTPPTVQITSPLTGTRIPNNGNVTITATATDNVGVVQVAFYVDGVLLATDTSAPYSAHWNAKKAANVNHYVLVTAWDAAGNHSSAAITLIP